MRKQNDRYILQSFVHLLNQGSRHEKINFDARADRKRSLIARLRSETGGEGEGDEVSEFDSSALEDRVRRILQKGKYR